MMGEAPVISLIGCESYEAKELEQRVGEMLDKAEFGIKPGMKVLVKPNLLVKRELACTNPRVTAAVCIWLLDQGVKPVVADSPGFGKVETVAQGIGLTRALEPLGLTVNKFDGFETIRKQVAGRTVKYRIARLALESDRIISLCKVKAHSQLRMTLCVKNCFGLVPGLHKAFFHSLYGQSTQFFAECLLQLYGLLPKVNGVADGIVAMTRTGPQKGDPFPLKLLGAAADPMELDAAITEILGIDQAKLPMLFYPISQKKAGAGQAARIYPLARPEDFDAAGFSVPEMLKDASFSPGQLARSCFRRLVAAFRKN